jgi:hypothetical protein
MRGKPMNTTQFYFDPQRGIIQNQPIRSNFYIYRLPGRCLAKVQLVIQGATLGSGGFSYDKEFLEWLEKNDTKWDQHTGLATSSYAYKNSF